MVEPHNNTCNPMRKKLSIKTLVIITWMKFFQQNIPAENHEFYHKITVYALFAFLLSN